MSIDNFKILNPIVVSNVVLVVDIFCWKQFSSKVLLHDVTVFLN